MPSSSKPRLILFLKVPEVGRVKTRLIPIFSPEQACAFYQVFLKDIISTLQSLPLDVFYFFAPSPLSSLLSSEFQIPQESCFPQSEGDLGKKMSTAFSFLFQQKKEPILILGTDSPGLPSSWILEAFHALKHHQVVLGPSFDGGYYLLGMDQYYPELFQEISWSTSSVFSQTLQRLSPAHSLFLLPPFYDVDYPQDLAFLKSYLSACQKAQKNIAPQTLKLLEQKPFTEILSHFS